MAREDPHAIGPSMYVGVHRETGQAFFFGPLGK
jgi:hypothetical protein